MLTALIGQHVFRPNDDNINYYLRPESGIISQDINFAILVVQSDLKKLHNWYSRHTAVNQSLSEHAPPYAMELYKVTVWHLDTCT